MKASFAVATVAVAAAAFVAPWLARSAQHQASLDAPAAVTQAESNPSNELPLAEARPSPYIAPLVAPSVGVTAFARTSGSSAKRTKSIGNRSTSKPSELWSTIQSKADPAGTVAGDAVPAVPTATAVRIERIKPAREKYPTLRFLKDNRDFIRSRFDLLRERELAESGRAGEIDPRFLAYRRMIADATASHDSLARAQETSRRWELFANITDLGRLEDQLDLMDRQLADQKVRLSQLQRDFTGRQLTSLAVVLSGFPATGDPSQVTLVFEPGDTLSVPLSAEIRESLRHGGVLELCHRLVEPREQMLSIALAGERWDDSDAGFLTLDPARDQLTFLRLDLAAARPSEGASSMVASRWINDTGLEASRGPETQP